MSARETGRFVVEMELGGLLTVVELEREVAGGRVSCLATQDGRPVYRVADGVYQVGEVGGFAYRLDW